MVSISVPEDELCVSEDFHLVIPGLGTIHINIQDLLLFPVAFLVVPKCHRSLCPGGSSKLETKNIRRAALWHTKSNDNYGFF